MELPMISGLSARRLLQGAIVLSLFPLSAFADTSEVLVTASRVTESTADSLWSSSVLTREDIESRQASSVQDLLADLAGVNIDNTGGLGKTSSVFIRGANSDHTLLLVDGVKMGSATAGTPPFELLPLDQIDRIEVVRGPRSTLYGSDAMGGVVQIFTRRQPQAGLSFGGSIMDGSHNTHDLSANLQASGERAWVSLGAENLTTDGINSCLPGAAAAMAGCFTYEPDLDGFRNHSASVAAGVHFTDRLSAQLSSLLTNGWTYFDGDFTNQEEFSQRVTSLRLDGSLSDAWHASAAFGRNVDVEKNFHDSDPAGRFDTTRDSASAQIDGTIASMLRLIGGVDYENDRVDSDTAYDRTSRWTRGVFTELRGESGPWAALAGARLEDNEQFGNHVTGNVGIARRAGDRVRLTLTWGTAFHAPTFNDLYYPGFGNPNLGPEESRSVELGADATAGRLRWSLHLYQTHIEQLIALDSVTFLPRNIDRARITGGELQGDWRSAQWQVSGQLSLMDPLNLSSDATGGNLLLPRRSKNTGTLDVRRLLPEGMVGAVARWQGRRYDDLANTLPMGGYFTLDLIGQWRFARGWLLQASFANVLDRSYQTAAFFAQDGFHYSVTVRYQSAPRP
jgi:vitamin B12 transporter